MEDKKTYIMMTFAALCWAGAFIAGKIAMAELPVFSMGLAAPILHETIGWYNIVGMFMIIAGVYTNSTIKEKKIARFEEHVS
ncbi:MAG: hypothetical protein JJE29_05610 [Peptostreptococcaceae bacterium]|nr:hypothetical protein [Peptostreptococcaceae bacterium]